MVQVNAAAGNLKSGPQVIQFRFHFIKVNDRNRKRKAGQEQNLSIFYHLKVT